VTGPELARRAVRMGAIGGAVAVYLAAVGMIEKFDGRNLVLDVVTLGLVLMAGPVVIAGWLAARPRIRGGAVERPAPRAALAAGALSGLLTGALTAALVMVTEALPDGAVRDVFVAISPKLLTILTFGGGLGGGTVILLLGGAALGALGAGYPLLPRRARRPLTAGLVTVLTLALLQRIVPPMMFQLYLDSTWLYSRIHGGLTLVGAVVAFAAAAAVAELWMARGQAVRRRVDGLPERGRATLRLAAFGATFVVLLALPLLLGSALSQILGSVGIYVLMGLGLNIVVGYAGLLDLGYVAFFAAGAYPLALLTGARLVTSLGDAVPPAFSANLSFYLALPIVVLVAMLLGILIGAPVLRLRGDYLAIVTLGFGEIARVLVTSDWLKGFLGGAQGIRDIPAAPIGPFSFRDPQSFYYMVLSFCLLAVFVSHRLHASRVGRAWTAMREDELSAEAMGVSSVRYKLLAFAMGAAVGCLSGALFAVQIGSLTPVSFDILVSITALAVVVLGGMGSIPGVIVGALVLIGLPGLLTEFEEYRLLIYGAVLVGIMILRPQGLIPNVRRMRELREEELGQDTWVRRRDAAATEPAPISIGDGGGGV
jgi:branched-chain amino acid transport system permease protein